MTTTNNITGKLIRTKANSKEFRDNFCSIIWSNPGDKGKDITRKGIEAERALKQLPDVSYEDEGIR